MILVLSTKKKRNTNLHFKMPGQMNKKSLDRNMLKCYEGF